MDTPYIPMAKSRGLTGLLVIKAVMPDEAYFWATHSGAEIDLMFIKQGRMYGVECKRVDAPRITPSMHIARTDLHLEQIAVVYPGTRRYPLADGINAVPLEAITDGMKGLYPERKLRP